MKKANEKNNQKKAVSIVAIILIFVIYICINVNFNEIKNGNFDSLTDSISGLFEKEKVSNNKYLSSENIDGDLSIYFFNVGQADCIFVNCDGNTMIIDAGNNKDGKLICNYLKENLGIEKINYVIGTHPHEDHIGGLDDVIKNFNIGRIFMPKRSTTTKTFAEVLDAAEKKNRKIISPKIGYKFNLGEAVCEVIYIDDEAEELNNASLVLEMTYGDQKYLFTGDIEASVENMIEWEDIDVLKVAHHGSRSSSTERFLEQTKPEISIISLGKNNEYGFPHDITMKKLNQINTKVYRTDTDGTILLSSDGKSNIITKLDVSLDGD